jgi:hypothetical protein
MTTQNPQPNTTINSQKNQYLTHFREKLLEQASTPIKTKLMEFINSVRTYPGSHS